MCQRRNRGEERQGREKQQALVSLDGLQIGSVRAQHFRVGPVGLHQGLEEGVGFAFLALDGAHCVFFGDRESECVGCARVNQTRNGCKKGAHTHTYRRREAR